MSKTTKVIGMQQSVNSALAKRAVAHAVRIQRLKTSEVKAISTILNKTLYNIRTLIRDRLSGIDAGTLRSGFRDYRLSAMKQSIKSMMDSGMKSAYETMQARLTAIAHAESQFEVVAVKNAVSNMTMLPFDFIAPSQATLQAMVSNRPIVGNMLQDWFENLAAGAQDKISRHINLGLVEGNSVDQIVRDVLGSAENAFDGTSSRQIRAQAEAVVRTAVGNVSNSARELTYQANEDVIKGVQILATLDPRTCEICMAQDGRVYDIDDGLRPPFHVNCRCTTVPVLKSWKEMGIKAKEIDAGTRASMDGQVPASMTYGEWLKTQSPDVQDEALGKTRAGLFRSGQVAIDRFVDNKSRPLTLDQIRRREGI